MEKLSAKTILFNTAMTLFRRKGYEQVSIQEICRESGLTRNAFYYYFTSKDALLSSYFENAEDFERSLLDDIKPLPDDLERLWYVFAAHLRMMQNEGLSLCRAFIRVTMEGNGKILNHYYVSENLTIPLLAACQKAGLVKNTQDPTMLIYLTTHMVAGIFLNWCAEEGGFALLDACRTAFDILLQSAVLPGISAERRY